MTCGLPEVLQTKYFSFPFALQENSTAYFHIHLQRSKTNPHLTESSPGAPARAAGLTGSHGKPLPSSGRSASGKLSLLPAAAQLPSAAHPPRRRSRVRRRPPNPAHLRPHGRAPAFSPGPPPPPSADKPPSPRRCGAGCPPGAPAADGRGAYLRRGARGPAGSGPAGRRGRGGRSRAAPRGRGRRRGRRLPRRRWGGPAAAWAAPGSSRAPAPGSEAAR